MKESKLVKIVLIITMSLIVLLGLNTKQSFAANNITITDLTGTVNNTTGNNTTGNNTAANNTVANNTTANKTTANNTATNNVLKTNNTSNYNNSSLPDTGIEDSMPTVILLVVFGISAVYAYKKMQDYKSL